LRFLSMHRSRAASAVLLLAGIWLSPAVAQQTVTINAWLRTGGTHVQRGKVTGLDPATMNFICQGSGLARRYWVARTTRFLSGRPNASFYDLAPGQTVEVIAHAAGAEEIADVIRF
jgi:hypothetical protein